MGLDWYKGIETVLRVDPNFSVDHVTAYNNLSIKANHHISTSLNRTQRPTREDFLIHNGFKKRIPLQTVKPIMSKIFTKHVIMKSLKNKFKESWRSVINNSNKLEFYRKVKQEFIKESYLDFVQNYSDRVSLTRLRISAHRLEVELGRRHNIPRSERICNWCEQTLGTKEVENEIHFLEQCGNNASSRLNFRNKATNILASTDTTHKSDQIHLIQSLICTRSNLSTETQVHLSRTFARFVRNSFKSREKFLDSLKS